MTHTVAPAGPATAHALVRHTSVSDAATRCRYAPLPEPQDAAPLHHQNRCSLCTPLPISSPASDSYDPPCMPPFNASIRSAEPPRRLFSFPPPRTTRRSDAHCEPEAAAVGGLSAACFSWKSLTAALTASSASIEQCSFTGGSFKCFAMSLFLMLPHSSSVLPFSHSVAYDEEAMAEPHPNVCAQTGEGATREGQICRRRRRVASFSPSCC